MMGIICTALGVTQRRKLRRLIRKRDGDDCWICSKKMPTHDMSIDHVIPRSEGGTNVIENLKLAHRFCNESRTWPETTFKRLQKLSAKARRRIYG